MNAMPTQPMLSKSMLSRGASLLLFALLMGSTGCATLLKPKTETVALQSNPGDADVYIDGAPRGRTPLMLELQPNKEYTVVFKKPGYADQAHVITSSVSGKWVVLDVFGGLLPVIIDAATGSWKQFDSTLVNVTLPALRQDERDGERDVARLSEREDEEYEEERQRPAPTRRARASGRGRVRSAPQAADTAY